MEAEHYAEALTELELCLKRRGETTDVFFYDIPTIRYQPPLYSDCWGLASISPEPPRCGHGRLRARGGCGNHAGV